MGTTCSLPNRKNVSRPSKIISMPVQTRGISNNNDEKGASHIFGSPPSLEEPKTTHTLAPTYFKYDIRELGIGEYYLEKDPVEIKPKKGLLKRKKKDSSKANKTVKWDRAIVMMRVRLGLYSNEDSLYNQTDICLREYALFKPEKYAKMSKYGPPMRYRWSVWKNFLDIDKFYIRNLYEKLKGLASPWETIIKKDIHRSFPDEPYFSSSKFDRIGQEQLFSVLKAISLYFPNIGYTQSMNFIIGFLLLVSGGNEFEVFWMFITIARDHRFLVMGLFEKELPLLEIYIHIFYEILEESMPNVYTHIKHHQLPDQLWLLKWFMTMFVYSFPPKYVVRIWDFILEQGLIGTVKVALGIIKFIENDLLSLDIFGMDQLFKHLNPHQGKAVNKSFSAQHRSLHDQLDGHNFVPTITNQSVNHHHQGQEVPMSIATVPNDVSEIHFSFKELDINEVLSYAKKVDLGLPKLDKILKEYKGKFDKDFPKPYDKFLNNLEEYFQSPKKLEELQKDLEYHIVKMELSVQVEVNNNNNDNIIVTDLLVEPDTNNNILQDIAL